jgi:hypothetical protein
MINAIRVHQTGGPDVLQYEQIEIGEPGGFSWKSAYLRYQRPRGFAVLSGFGCTGGFAYRSNTFALQRTIPSVRARGLTGAAAGAVAPKLLRVATDFPGTAVRRCPPENSCG